MLPLAARRFLLATALFALAEAARAQCSLQPSPGPAQPQLSGFAQCSVGWDPDGAGPSPQVLVVGGSGLVTDHVFDARLMTWDGTAWHTLGGLGPVGITHVAALIVWNGQLFAAGHSGVATSTVQMWNGTTWQAVGTPLPNPVGNLVVWNGNLVAVANPSFPSLSIHLLNGTTWTTLPTPPTVQHITSVVAFQGLLCVAGSNSALTQGVLERWNGTSWLPSIVTDVSLFNDINQLAVRSSLLVGGTEVLYAGGQFTTIGSNTATNIAVTSGGSAFAWSPLGPGLPARCTSLTARNTGLTSEVVAGYFVSSASPMLRYAVPSTGGTATWSPMGLADLSSVRFFAGQYFGTRRGPGDAAVVRYDGTAWTDVVGPGFDGQVRAATRFGADAIVGGTFSTDGTTSLARVARWNGTSLQPLGSGIQGTSVDALLTLADGNVVAGGLFASAGGTAAANIARWNGTTWSPLGLGLNGQVLALAEAANGDLLAGGKFTFSGAVPCARVARWDGTAWSALGFGMTGDVNALLARANGTVIAGGSFNLAGGVPANNIAQWNGSAWSSLGSGTNGPVFGLTQRPNGEVVAVGDFSTAGGIAASLRARWFGTWSAMGTASGSLANPPRAVITLPNGDVLAGRGFHQPSTTLDDGISRWNGTSWSSVGVTLGTSNYLAPIQVQAMALQANGDLVLGGYFNTAGNAVASGLTRLSPTCAATATPYGAGCTTAAGPLVLRADTLPWIGSTLRTTTTGIGPVSLCLGLTGFAQQSIPLSLVLPQGQPGCTLLSSSDLIDLLPVDANGTATSSLALANSASLIGAQFFQQAVPLEFNAQFALTAVRGSNALQFVIGSL